MNSESANTEHMSSSPGTEDDSYVDPILFAEGVYADQEDYERTIDGFADRINKGLIPKKGREPKAQPDKVIDTSADQKPQLKVVFDKNAVEVFVSNTDFKIIKAGGGRLAEGASLVYDTRVIEEIVLGRPLTEEERVTYDQKHTGLQEVVQQLVPEQRKIVELIYFGGFTEDEVAKDLSIPLGTVNSRARAALRVLAKLIG